MHTFFAPAFYSFIYTNSLANTHTHTRIQILDYSYAQTHLFIGFAVLLLLLLTTLLLLHLFLHFVWLLCCSAWQIFLPSNGGNDLLYCALIVVVAVFVVFVVKLSPSSLGIISKGIPLSFPYAALAPFSTQHTKRGYICM